MMRIIFTACFLFALAFVAFGQQGKYAKVNGTTIHYREWGRGKEAVILLHSLSDTSLEWSSFAPRLARNYRVIAPDRRGVGKSAHPLGGYDLKNLVMDVEQLADKLNLERFHLVGNSAGGNVAMALAAKSPERIKTLTLIEGGFFDKRPAQPLPDCPAGDKECMISRAFQQAIDEYDAEEYFPGIKSPTLLVVGIPNFKPKRNATVEEWEMREGFYKILDDIENTAKSKFADGRLLKIQGAQHWVFKDQPVILAREMLKFFRSK